MDIIDRLLLLQREAIGDRGHTYTALTIGSAIDEINRLRERVIELERGRKRRSLPASSEGHG